jgi:hypothetical protein
MIRREDVAVDPGPPDVALPERRPLHCARWGALTISLDEDTLTAIARKLVEAIPELEDLRVRVAPGELTATLSVRRFGVPLSARAALSQLRMKDGFLAFVLERVDALSFIPIPDALLAYVIEKAPAGLLTYYRQDRILVVNLNNAMPPGLDLTLDGAEFLDGEVRLRFGPGTLDLTEVLQDGPRSED